MRRAVSGGLILLVCLLAVCGVWNGIHRDAPAPLTGAPGSEAAGLILLEEEQGVLVLAVTEDSPANRAGVEPGDYLLLADETAICSLSEADEALKKVGRPLVLTLQRGEHRVQVLLDGR